ncbi:MAG: transglutaminase domain-containing protein [Deltaproteobacteria bacterium]|nr:transglutaminase domain-containing protein [Deltaproteobacteria bacterium]
MNKRRLINNCASTIAFIFAFSFAFSLFFAPRLARAATLVLDGTMNEAIEIKQERRFATPREGLKKLTFRYANPASFSSGSTVQTVSNRTVAYNPKPFSVADEKDAYGNVYTVVEWADIREGVSVAESYTVKLDIKLKDMNSAAQFPLNSKDMPEAVRVFLNKTQQVSTDAVEIKELASQLTVGSATEHAAVMSILNWVVDNIKYKTPIPDYGALATLKTGYGNCQNYAHLAIALMRSVGIPARIVGGISLEKKWKAPLVNGALVQSIGQGGHAWMEVWYPDLGWMPFDAQQSHLFVGPRHIKQTVGLDSVDVNDSWRAQPSLPPFSEEISADFTDDTITLVLKKTLDSPANYIMTTSVEAVRPVQPVKKTPETAPLSAGRVEFGNIEFPAQIGFFVATGADAGRKTFDKETAEYVTGDVTYAQAFMVEKTMRLDNVSLAMHKFGGRLGSLWLDVVKDKDGRPGMEGVRSMPLGLDTVKYHSGYSWFDFGFSADEKERPVLEPGRHWIVLRRSKDAIVNWFYTPGNQYGKADDARSTEKGIDWSNIMNYDFNFKVSGYVERP